MSNRILLLLFCFSLFGCVACTDEIWSSPDSWYESPREFNEDFVDVFYIASTNVINQYDSDGIEVYNAILDSTSKASFDYELKKASERVFSDSLNFFSPYYHQATMGAYVASGQTLMDAITKAKLEIFDAFDYYMKNQNGGRRFILAGFSQGAQLVKELLKRLDDEQYSRLVAAYVIGFGLSEDDAKNPHIKPAVDAVSNGVTVSYNTVADTSAIYDIIYCNSIACINPVNWKTDSTPAEFIYKDNSYHVYVDTVKNVLIVNDFEAPQTAFSSFFPKGCLHSWEISFYASYLGENAKRRAYYE